MTPAPVEVAKNIKNVVEKVNNKKVERIMDSNNIMVQGFKGSAVAAGIKKDKSLDLSLIFSEKETAVAGVFTANKVKAAPIHLSIEHIKNKKARAIIANSGNANACTGDEGMNHASTMTKLAAEKLGVNPEDVLVGSTGVIGTPLNIKTISNAIPELVNGLTPEGISEAAKGIMTTDSFPKTSSFIGSIDNKDYKITGIAKGAGMIMPNMATMLCFIMTDLKIDADKLQEALSLTVKTSFNRITVDGDTSTNDMVLVMANGMAENRDLNPEDYETFIKGLNKVMTDLSIMIVKDGEGATKTVCIAVKGATSKKDADEAVRTVANSSLVKTAFYGQDPNWGRVMAALGRADITMKEELVSIWIDDVQIVKQGLGMGPDYEKKAAKKMQDKEFSLVIDLNQGEHEDLIITSDLTHDYININADYRS